ncbi:PREDICTED: probable prefoldin subunit 5 [Bactrocera latifrons]|uniref:Putative prefoldin subunit 5 n=2 Tax=Bactrocera TaxID=47832 RepID=A0A034WMX6_BACDO|nr:probable prefoldin subunit 5 [Bactrocera oleae]XP_018795925.1 PREDICTED: probable prefoldin subunit 5 [Bactrocera latifrons]XP_039963371.1 probable prefoldin subunit 5 [Bactrocera tryoni]XP_050317617.1 probable prefoldin subunit 5 [Bactrocera neohumeralis]
MSASSSDVKTEQIDLAKLSLEQLMQIRQEMEKEINSIQASLQTLYNCKAKYASSKEALESFQPEWQNRQVLVPLTSSMYVPGRIKDLDNFVIDVGTGYYVEKNLESSKDYFMRRVDYLQEQIEKIEKIQIQKSRFLNAVAGVMEMKQLALSKQMQQQQSA